MKIENLLLYFFQRRYKSPFSRLIYKSFFNSIRFFKRTKFNKPSLNLVQENYFHELESKGWCIIDTDEINKNKFEAIDIAEEIFKNNNSFNYTQKNYLKSIDFSLSESKGKIFHDFFTNKYIIDIVSKYLNDKPLLTELKLLYSPASIDQIYSGSQLLHSDFDDTKVVKIFVFIDGVDEDSGPLQLVNKEITKKIIKLSKYRWGQISRKYKSHDDNLLELISDTEDKEKITSLIGNRGTVVLADTVNCLHRGSRNPIKPRRILYATFSTRTSFRFPPINWLINNNNTILKSSPLNLYKNEWGSDFVTNI